MTTSFTPIFEPQVLGTLVATIGSVPSAPTSTILVGGRVRFANTDSAPHAVTLYAVPPAAAPGVGNAQMNAETIGANSHKDVDIPLLPAGGSIQALADAAGLVTISQIAGALVS